MEKLKKINTTLVLIFKENKVLLAQKKRGFAQGTFNGIGGKQDEGESIQQAMIRETQEEIGVTPTLFEQVGLINFDVWYKGEHADLNLNIFTCSKYEGEIVETEEMAPQWFELENIPYDKMLPDDVEWLPIVLKGGYVIGKSKLESDLKTCTNKIYSAQKSELDEYIKNVYGDSELTK